MRLLWAGRRLLICHLTFAWLAIVAAFVLLQPAIAERSFPGSKPQIARVTVSLVAGVKEIAAGKRFQLGVLLKMPAGWHTYYKVSGEAGKPTSIDWRLPPGFQAGPLEWQKPVKFTDAGITTYGYEGRTLIASSITPPDILPAAGTPLHFSAYVHWLQCKDLCVPGQAEVNLTLPVSLTAEPAANNTNLFATVGYEGRRQPGLHMPARLAPVNILTGKLNIQGMPAQAPGLVNYLLLAFVGGVILNLMPCVLPVISIKVLGFVEHSGVDRRRVWQMGLVFSAGIICSFLALSGLVLILRKAGQQVGWGFQFQHPAFVIAMCVIVLLFALSLFGLFHVATAPGQGTLNAYAGREGHLGTFFKGVLATTLSTPCTAPYLGTAVGFAFTQSAWVIVSIFFMVGLGMSFPYLVLTAQPDWLKFIPRPGVWMEKFKVSLGFILLATVIWLLSVLGAQVGFEQALSVAAFLLFVSFGVWCISSFTDLTSTAGRKSLVWAIALVVAGLGYYFFIATVPGLGLSPPRPATFPAGSSPGEIEWLPFSIEMLDSQLSAGKTVFLDFTAQWCLTCKVNEQAVINTKAVKDKLKKLNVVAIKADWTKQEPQVSALLRKFGRSGVPLYVIFPAGRPSEPIVLPEVITLPIVLAALDKAGASK